MNLVGLWRIWLLFFTQAPCSRLCLFQLPLILLGCALGLILFSPDLAWYRGLSGTLHGLLALALLSQWGNQPFIDSLLLALFLAKVAWEQKGGPMPGSEAWIDGRVIVDSHLYGTISGSIIWMLTRISNPATEKLS
jgi:rhomboid family GlyGly-CTERM serine protease